MDMQAQDKRLELASRKRSYEIGHVTKCMRMDEDATWSWWKVARDDLQTDMISETNRKRRRMKRERRAIERPQPIRRIPILPQDLPLHHPSAKSSNPSLSAAHGSALQQSIHRHHPHQAQQLVYLELTTLSATDCVE
ncbi:hypothetical protein Hypma_016582 [Hypsizygus marmoreus]|uniref:Uncharacterized protein n=1 Tax=Hypsizygus marmoreus TaxID=39966 RepID=A0A369J2E0_HYPMA|nr:hypothetical protein Hypma_016582 [Hypsizygus marmoreus]